MTFRDLINSLTLQTLWQHSTAMGSFIQLTDDLNRRLIDVYKAGEAIKKIKVFKELPD